MVRNSGTNDISRRTSVANRLRIMSAKNPGLDDMIDRIIDNPAYDQMGLPDFPQKIRYPCDNDPNRTFCLHYSGSTYQ